MRRCFVTILILVASGPGLVPAAQENVTVAGRTPYSFSDIPTPFRFLFEGAIRAGGLNEAWAGLPFDSITLERTTCLGTCPAYTVTFYRGTSKSVGDESFDDRFGRAVLTVTRVARTERYSRRFPEATGNFEGRVDVWTFGNLSYLIQKWGVTVNDGTPPLVRTDAPAAILRVSGPAISKTVSDYGGVRTIELWSIHEAIDSAAKSIAWRRR
jgi:hypothetical protein